MKPRQNGFSLVELIVTLLISALLIAAVSTLLLQSRRMFAKQQALSVLVEDGRYAVEVIARELRLAGFLVHPNRPLAEPPNYRRQDLFSLQNNVTDSGIDLAPNEHIRGSFNGSGFANPADTNRMVFRYQINPSGSCSDRQFTVKAECRDQGFVWTAGGIDLDLGGTPCSALVDDEKGGVLAFTKAIYFFVNDTGTGPALSCRAATLRRILGTPAVSGTVVDDNAGQAMPLVSNVEALHIFYGEDTDADGFANRYVTADFVANWVGVVAARFYLVLRSAETGVATGDTSTYRVEDQTFNVLDPGARRLYRVFTTTVALRN